MTDQLGLMKRDTLLTAKDVQSITGIKSRATLWRKSNNDGDRFPRAYREGTHFTRWKLSEINAWINALQSDGT